jgi:PAS domain S-box-containing protein
VTAKKKKPGDTPGIGHSLRDVAEEQLARSPKHSSDIARQTPEQLIHELEVHQVELETQAEELRRAHLALEESRDKYLYLYDFAPVGYLTLTDKALIAEVNLAGAALLGVERSNLVHHGLGRFITSGDLDQWDQYFMHVRNRGEKQVCTLMLTRGDGSMFPARLEGVRTSGSDGTTTVRIAFSDITDIWQIEALKSQYSILNGIMESTDAAVFSLDRKYRYTSFNSHHAMVMKQLYGADIEPGHIIFDYQSVKEDQVRAKHNLDRALAGEHVTEEAFSGEEGRSRYYFEVTHYPIIDTGKKVIGVAVFAQDITGRKASEKALQLTLSRLESAMEAGNIAWWEMDCTTGNVTFSERKARMLGYPAEQFSHYTDFTTLLHPDDSEPAMQEMRDHLSGLKKKYEVEYRIRNRDGGYRWFHDIGRISEYAPDGKPHKVTGLVIDISERKRSEEALLRVNQKLNILSQLTRKDLTSQAFVLNSYLELTKNQLAGQDRIIETVQKGIQAIRLIHETIEYSMDYQDMGATPPKWQNVKMALLLGLSHISIGKIQHSIETGDLEIYADPLLEMVCQRLCENSVKHGDHVTMIRVWHTITPDRATIVFEDDGIGIPQELKEQIFLRDEGTGRASMRSLIFVREILDITYITIRETGEPGRGVRFEITVPKDTWRIAENCK